MAEIRASLNAGKMVITHTDAINVPGWSGAGYIILDPETGVGAYKISGGGNGVWLAIAGALIATIGIVSLISVGVSGGPITALFSTAVITMGVALATAGIALITGAYAVCSTAISVAVDSFVMMTTLATLGAGAAAAAITFKSYFLNNTQDIVEGVLSASICHP